LIFVYSVHCGMNQHVTYFLQGDLMSTEAKRAGNARHLEKLGRIDLRPYKEEAEQIKAAAAAAGQSMSAYILQAVRERMAREKN